MEGMIGVSSQIVPIEIKILEVLASKFVRTSSGLRCLMYQMTVLNYFTF